MKHWVRHARGLHNTGPIWVRIFGDGFTGTVFETSNAEGNFAWYVADRDEPGAKTYRQGVASSIDEAKLSADAAVLDRKRGRSAAVGGQLTTSTDRNRRRIDRLLASERQARRLTEDLAVYHHELVAAGSADAAARIARLLRRAAIAGLSDYMRRTTNIRGPSESGLSLEAHERAVLEIADQLDVLADSADATYVDVEALGTRLRQMGAFPDPDLYSAAVQSFLLRVQTESR